MTSTAITSGSYGNSENSPANYWVVQAPKNIRDNVEHDRFIGIGFVDTALGDLSHFSKEELRSRVESLRRISNVTHATNQLWRFVNEIKQGDYVLVPLIGRGRFHVGQVTGVYTFDPSHPMPHRRSVKWFQTNVSKDVLNYGLGRATVHKADRHREIIDRLVREGSSGPPCDLNDLANHLRLNANFLQNIQTLLEDKTSRSSSRDRRARARPTSPRNSLSIWPGPMSVSHLSSSTRPTPTRTSYRASDPHW